jgi:hypothetical protein
MIEDDDNTQAAAQPQVSADTLDIQALESEFYSKKIFFSYSSLNKLLNNPRQFYREYVLQLKDEDIEAYMIRGKVIHCLLLEKEKFDKYFIVSPDKLPSENIKKVIDNTWEAYLKLKKAGQTPSEILADHSEHLLNELKAIDLYQTLKTDDQRVAKVCTIEGIAYWDFLYMTSGKHIISQEVYNECLTAANQLKYDKTIAELMQLEPDDFNDRIERYNEIELKANDAVRLSPDGLKITREFPFGLKGILDNLVLDMEGKIIRVNDIKTTSKSLKDFKDAVEYYRYSLQAAIYRVLAFQFLRDKGIEDWMQWKVVINFIVIDRDMQYYPFEVSAETLDTWMFQLGECLEIAYYHYVNRKYGLPYEFCTGKVKL